MHFFLGALRVNITKQQGNATVYMSRYIRTRVCIFIKPARDLAYCLETSRESPAQFKNRIKPRKFVRRKYTMYEKAQTDARKINSVA